MSGDVAFLVFLCICTASSVDRFRPVSTDRMISVVLRVRFRLRSLLPFRDSPSRPSALHAVVQPGALLLLALCGIMLVPMAAQAQRSQQDAILRGFVRDASSGRPLSGANVVLLDSTTIVEAAATTSEGFYQLIGMDPGTYTVRVTYVGYSSQKRTVTLGRDARTLEVSLAPSAEQLEGITVEARRQVKDAEAGLRSIQPADLATIPSPGPGSDLAGYLRSLPGVATVGDRGGRLYVRGGTPSQNLVLVDGTPIYKPFHIIGFYSAFPSELVASADFYAGGFGAEYRGALSSVLDVNLRPGNLRRFEGGVSGSPFVTSARVEGPIVDGSASFLVHGRHSLIESAGPNLFGEETPYRFYDITTRFFTQDDNTQCSVTGIRTYDRGAINPDRDAGFRWSNSSVGARCLTFGSNSPQVVDVQVGTAYFTNEVTAADRSSRSSTTWTLQTTLNIEQPYKWGRLFGGFQMATDQFSYDFNEPFVGITAEDEFLFSFGGHFGAGVDIGDQFRITPSIGSQFPVGWAQVTVEPRLRASWRPGGSESMKATFAGGLYRQLTDAVTDERDAGSTFLAWVADPQSQALSSVHGIMGWNQQLTDAVKVSIEGYYKDTQDVPVAEWTPQPVFNTELARANSEAYGGNATVEYTNDRVDIALNYGIGWVEYSAAEGDLGAWTGGTVFEYNPPHDQRHQFGIRTSVETLGGTGSLRWQFSTGRPFTQAYGKDSYLEIIGARDQPTEDAGIPRVLYSRTYGARLPSYHRLDASFERPFQLRNRTNLTVEIGAINAYDRSNVFYVDLFTNDRVDQLPVIPYVGLELSFE